MKTQNNKISIKLETKEHIKNGAKFFHFTNERILLKPVPK